MNEQNILKILNENYSISFQRIEFIRDSGCLAYAVYSENSKYFLRIPKPNFLETAEKSLEIQFFLQKQGFYVPKIIVTKEEQPCVYVGDGESKQIYVLNEFLEGTEVDPEQDAEAIGALVGQLHRIMKSYPGELIQRDKHYYIDRYIEIQRKKQYAQVEKFEEYGNQLWKCLENVPRGYCHGDLYRGNILKTPSGNLYVLDFDTFCEGYSMYDSALICNLTDYFKWEEDGYNKTKAVYERFLPEYLKYNDLSQVEVESLYDMIALYHFALQATIIEIFGIDCVENAFFDRQLAWLNQWRKYTNIAN